MIPVCFSTDHNFIMPTGVAIQSMLKHTRRRDFDVIILSHKSVTEQDEAVLSEIVGRYGVQIRFLKMDNTFDGAFEIRGITASTYYRLLLPWILPEYDKVLYLDGDIVVMGDISELYSMDLGDCYVAGRKSKDVATLDMKTYVENLDLDYDKYFNGGVLLLNTKLIRQDKLKSDLLAQAGKKYTFQDQDILNIVLKEHIMNIDIKYNYTPSAHLKWGGVKPCVIHYTGGKPWKVFTYHWYEWYAEYRESPFYDPELGITVYDNVQNRSYSGKEILRIILKKYAPRVYLLVQNRKR